MGYKASRINFEASYLEWCSVDYWKSLEGKKLFEKYGQAKLDCMLAELQYKEEIGMADFKETENIYHKLLEMAERTKRVSQIMDSILLTLINY